MEVIDSAVLSELHRGSIVCSAVPHGNSQWAETTKIVVLLKDEGTKAYFLKCATGDKGKAMVIGEYESMKAIHLVVPNFCPEPIAWGTYKKDPSTHFFLSNFHEMQQSLPNPDELCRALTLLHTKGNSPNGKFGFHVTTFNGSVPLQNSWKDTWEEFFLSRSEDLLRQDRDINGVDSELEDLSKPFLEVIIPRLLGPLEKCGKRLEPRLVHGDLWHGNIATDAETKLPLVFDASSFYGDPFWDLGNWRPERNKLSDCIPKYLEHNLDMYGVSVPVADINILYSTHFNLQASIMYGGEYRRMVINDIRLLLKKYQWSIC